MKREPLTVLLAKVWTAQTIEIDNAVEAAGASLFGRRFRISLATWANGLRVIDEAGTPLEQLRQRARADTNVGGLERWGWITVGDGEPGGMRRPGYGSGRGLRAGTVLRPTPGGTAARRLWPAMVQEVEDRWRHRFSPGLVDTLRRAGERITAGLPWAPPQVNPSDGFRTHLVTGDGQADGPDRPLVVLLGQALTALTARCETGALASLPLAANVLTALDDAAVPRRSLPARTGLSKEAIAMAVSFLARRELGTVGSGGAVSLTATGRAALADHRRRVGADAGPEGLEEAVASVLDQPAALAAGLEPPAGCWRSERPYLTQTRRLLADPVAALPRHPMVLHRGGWPDGS